MRKSGNLDEKFSAAMRVKLSCFVIGASGFLSLIDAPRQSVCVNQRLGL
jgi:hypothetical protein